MSLGEAIKSINSQTNNKSAGNDYVYDCCEKFSTIGAISRRGFISVMYEFRL